MQLSHFEFKKEHIFKTAIVIIKLLKFGLAAILVFGP